MTGQRLGRAWAFAQRAKWKPWLAVAVATILVVGVLTTRGSPRPNPPAAGSPPACARLSTPATPPLKPTTITAIEQAYRCILGYYYGGPRLDNRSLLAAAFAGLTEELQRHGLDQPIATLPALIGDRDRDWAAFSTAYLQVISELPADAKLLQALAAATLTAMVASLDDNHARWVRTDTPPGTGIEDAYGLGIAGLSGVQGSNADPAATPPLFVTSVLAGSPAAQNDVRAGDVIVSVNDVPPFANGRLSQGVVDWLNQQYPQAEAVRLRLHRPSTGNTWTATIKPGPYKASRPTVSADLRHGSIAYVKVTGFLPGAADQVMQAIGELRDGGTLRGVILDLRGVRGGAPAEVARLLGAFVHGKITSYDCDVNMDCTANWTDDTVPLLDLPFVALVDRACASACDDFSAAVKDLGLGTLVGTRTAGGVAGPAGRYLLDDNSLLLLPALHHLGANKELINTIGVAPDYYVALTADDLSAGRDPAIEKALSLLR